jgi:hypothetical protein
VATRSLAEISLVVAHYFNNREHVHYLQLVLRVSKHIKKKDACLSVSDGGCWICSCKATLTRGFEPFGQVRGCPGGELQVIFIFVTGLFRDSRSNIPMLLKERKFGGR